MQRKYGWLAAFGVAAPVVALAAFTSGSRAQQPFPGGPPPGGFGGPGGQGLPGGPGGPGFPGGQGFPGGPGRPGRGGGPMQQERKVVAQFDKDGDKRLNREERQAAREFLQTQGGGRPGGFGPRGGRGGNQEPPQPGARVSTADVKSHPNAGLYDPSVLRTLFFTFENAGWEKELADFHGTDVEVPAELTVDGKKYPGVGLHFRGASSYMMVGEGYKRSLNVSLDYTDSKQKLYGYKTLNLLNSNGDPTFLRAALYSHIARQYIPAPKVNLVKVVINGENWGVYANQQQFNKDFLKEWFPSADGVRWKVPGSPGGGGGLAYAGEDAAAYQRLYEIKTDDKKEAEQGWKDLIALCRTLAQAPTEQLESALNPILDIDGVLKFLAVENALINEDGYWIRASDFSLFRDDKGKFHVIPHDMNEGFKPAGGGPGGGPGGRMRPGGPGGPGGFAPLPGGEPGMPPPPGPGMPPPGPGGPADVLVGPGPGGPDFGGPGGPGFGGQGGRPGMAEGGIELDPLASASDARKPLLSRLLTVPALRARYLGYVRQIAQESMDWNKLRPVVAQYRNLIEDEVKADTRKLSTFAAFQSGIGLDSVAGDAPAGGGRQLPSLRDFVERRRAYLLNYQGKRQTADESGIPGARR